MEHRIARRGSKGVFTSVGFRPIPNNSVCIYIACNTHETTRRYLFFFSQPKMRENKKVLKRGKDFALLLSFSIVYKATVFSI